MFPGIIENISAVKRVSEAAAGNSVCLKAAVFTSNGCLQKNPQTQNLLLRYWFLQRSRCIYFSCLFVGYDQCVEFLPHQTAFYNIKKKYIFAINNWHSCPDWHRVYARTINLQLCNTTNKTEQKETQTPFFKKKKKRISIVIVFILIEKYNGFSDTHYFGWCNEPESMAWIKISRKMYYDARVRWRPLFINSHPGSLHDFLLLVLPQLWHENHKGSPPPVQGGNSWFFSLPSKDFMSHKYVVLP